MKIIQQCFILSVLVLTPFAVQAQAEARVHTDSDSLLARIQVEDFLHDYYWEISSGSSEGVTAFWAENAVFDVNGEILTGLQAIEDAYAGGLGPGGKLVFQMDIPRIQILGKRAVVDLIYTGVLNRDPEMAPALYEQGHDHLELAYIDGNWMIEKRALRSYSLDSSYDE